MDGVSWSQLKEEATRLAQEIGRSGREHHSLMKNSAVLSEIRRRGVPAQHREWVWPLLIHEQYTKLQRQCSEFKTYNQLLDGILKQEEPIEKQSDTTSMQQAQDDAMERFSHLNPFQERKIKRILVAYTKSKDMFYYCHGMVEICVVMSTFLVEEDAFWAMRLLLDVLLPKYHEESLMEFHMDCLVLQELLHLHDPVLYDHFTATGVTVQLLCTKWFFSFFAESMPFDLVCRLYDILFVDISSRKFSSKIIFSTSMAVFLYLSSTLAEVQDPSVMVEIICEFCWTTLSDYSISESFVDLILFLHDHITDEEIISLRRKYRDQLAEEEEQRKSLQWKMLKKKTSSKKHLRSGRKIQSIKLLIQWRNSMKDNGEDEDGNEHKGEGEDRSDTEKVESRSRNGSERDSAGDVEVELVTTPSEKEVLAKVYQGINRINRRRSRSTSLRNLSLRGNDLSILRGPFSSRTMSSSSIVFSHSSSSDSKPQDEEEEGRTTSSSVEDLECGEDRIWGRLQQTQNKDDIIRHSMGGIPDQHRVWVWPILLSQIPAPPNLPQMQPSPDEEDEETLLDREVAKSIENDISRTRNLKPDQVVPMRRVLTAFAIRNRRVGYCQGMNEILVVLLQYLDEQLSLVGLVLLIEVILPAYHVDSMIGLHTDCAVMNTLLRQNDPELHNHLNELGLNMEILCTKWLVTCYLTSLPSFCGLKVIDMLLARAKERQCASRVLLGVGISIFFTLRDILLDAKDAGEVLLAVNEYFAREMAKTTAEMDIFLHFCENVVEQLEPEIVEEFRSVHKDEVMERFAAFEAKKIEMRQQLEEAKAKQRKSANPPPSPPKPESGRLSSTSISGTALKSNGTTKKSGLSSYISKPLLGKSTAGYAGISAGDEKESRKEMFYQRVDVIEANRNFAEDLVKMEEQLEDLAELYARGKIDEKEHSCIKAQIVRKWCKGVNSPQTAMVRVRCVKDAYLKSNGTEGRISVSGNNRQSSSGSVDGSGRTSFVGGDGVGNVKKPPVTLYGRMKKARKSAFAIFKSTFE